MSPPALPRLAPRWLVVAAAVLALGVLTQSAQAAQRPAVAPKGSCTEMAGKRLVAVFDVTVAGKKRARVTRGRRNRVTGGRVIGRLPTSFRPGATRRALRVAFGRKSTRTRWRLGRRTATVKRATKRCARAKSGPSASSSLRPSGPGFCTSPAVAGAWTGAGRTISATPATLTSAVARAAPGDTVELEDGIYDRASVTLTKPIRLRAKHQFGAVFVGGPTPRYANDTGLGDHVNTAVAVRASGAMVEGLEMRYYETGVQLSEVADVVVQGNRTVSVYSAGIEVWDTRSVRVRCNQVLDPYLAQDPTATVTSGPDIADAQDDYGVVVYGTRDTRVEHNYFSGVFNQTLSFKEGNWDPYAGYNTFEGSALTALFFGQNIPHNGPYSFTGLPVDNDRGTLVGEYNVFREAYGIRDGARVVYYLRSPIRVWHVNGTTILRGNVVEQAQQGILLECRAGSQAGCNAGTTIVTGNTIGGRVRDLDGTLRQVNVTAGALVFTGLQARTAFDANVFAALPRVVGTYDDGVAGAPSYSYSANRELSTPAGRAHLDLRRATPATDPDLSYADAQR
ncbi:MAG TPA: hypothetical protein VF257_09110 [Solirubrobacteraceae bacterium]